MARNATMRRQIFLPSRCASNRVLIIVSVASDVWLQEILSWGIPPQNPNKNPEEEVAKVVEKYSDEIVDQWNKEIDGLLTFVRQLVMRDYNVRYSFLE